MVDNLERLKMKNVVKNPLFCGIVVFVLMLFNSTYTQGTIKDNNKEKVKASQQDCKRRFTEIFKKEFFVIAGNVKSGFEPVGNELSRISNRVYNELKLPVTRILAVLDGCSKELQNYSHNVAKELRKFW